MDANCFLNKEDETDRVIIFIHLPKSGGTTFCDIIAKQNQYHPDICIWRFTDLDGVFCNLNGVAREEEKRIEVVFGHMFFGVHKKLPQANFTYITFLRHPLERIISSYYYSRELVLDMNLRKLFKNMSLYDYVSSNQWNFITDMGYWPASTENLQTRMLAGTIEDDLETAKNNIKKYFSVVGTTERFDETLKIVRKKLGWDTHPYEKRKIGLNKPSLEEIPDEIIEIIKSKNEKDMALYEFANQLLDEELSLIE